MPRNFKDLASLEQLNSESAQFEYIFREGRDPERLRAVLNRSTDDLRPALFSALVPHYRAAANPTEFQRSIAQLVLETREAISTVERRQTTI